MCIPTYFDALNTNPVFVKLHHPSDLSKSTKIAEKSPEGYLQNHGSIRDTTHQPIQPQSWNSAIFEP